MTNRMRIVYLPTQLPFKEFFLKIVLYAHARRENTVQGALCLLSILYNMEYLL